MEWTTYADPRIPFPAPPTGEVILGTDEFSRRGGLPLSALKEVASGFRALGKRVVFDWDILMAEHEFERLKNLFLQLDLSSFHAIRVRDQGALKFLRDRGCHNIHLSLEGGNHNELGILKWVEVAGPWLERIVFSIEIDRQHLKKYISRVGVQTELLGAGPIALFYSPRALLSSPGEENPGEMRVEVVGQEDGHRRMFQAVENNHGTRLFLSRDFYLLEEKKELENMGLDYLRLDLGHLEKGEREEVWKNRDQPGAWPRPHLKGFFNANKSAVLFKHFKKHHLRNRDFVGTLVDVKRKSYMGFLCESGEPVCVGETLKMVTPEGREKQWVVHWLKDCSGREVETTVEDRLFYTHAVSGACVKAALYRSA